MAKNGLLVIRDFYEDSKFGRKWQIWEEYMKGLNKIKMRWQIRLPWQLLSFRKTKMVNLTKADQMFGKNSQMSWQTEKACEKLGTIWDWTSNGPWSNGAEMTEKYLTMDVTLLSRKNEAFLLPLTKIYSLTLILPSMHRDGIKLIKKTVLKLSSNKCGHKNPK